MNKRLLISSFLILQSILLEAQLSNSLPAYFHNFQVDPRIGNPALFNLNNKYETNLHYKSYLGTLSEIQIVNGSGYFIRDKKQEFGLRFQSEQEGKYFQRNRANFVYGVRLTLSEMWNMNAAGYLGAIFYSFKSSGNFQGGQDQSLDIGTGISLERKTLKIGIAANQINKTFLTPLLFEFQIRRYFEFHVENKFKLSNKWNLSTAGKYRLTNQPIERLIHTTILFSPENDSYNFGTHYIYNLGFSPTFGFKVPYNKSQDQFLGLNLSFFLAVNNITYDTFVRNQYEISVKWLFIDR